MSTNTERRRSTSGGWTDAGLARLLGDLRAAPRHTPGPWEVFHDHPSPAVAGNIGMIRPAGTQYGEDDIATLFLCDYPGGTGEAQTANARLIAASPDMHEALSMFVKQWEACGPNSDFGRYFGAVYHVARKALAKAGGAA